MGRAIDLTEYRLTMNLQKTNDCPYETKNFKVLNQVCRKRYKASEKDRIETISRGDLFTYTVGQGVLRCKGCPIVKEIPDKSLEAPLSHI